ncbi:MAG: type II toxin-antitoxin system HicA family toxin [Candidatus Pacebacteria bacterium]|nr:type II toxin-antitoxin system HicA family toxin [Candidatus Paceibacterota bacterium]
MPKLKVLSGIKIIKDFQKFGFSVVGQNGSHVKLKRDIDGLKQMLTIPKHSELGKGTIKAIYNQGLKYIPEAELKSYFYNNNK